MPDERTYGFSLQDATALTNSIGSGEGWYPEIKPRGGGGGTAEVAEPNPGVVTVEITGESDCEGELFDDLGYHVFLATIVSRPFGSPTEMRKERSGELTIFDPHGCMLDIEYDPEDFIGAIAYVSLMYGGEIFDEEYNFKDEATGENYVLPTDA